MAHFAELNESNEVLRVIVVGNNDILVDGVESEAAGQDFCANILGGRWVQTSYNGSIRKRFAAIGYSYNEEHNAFIAPRCHDEASIDSSSLEWNCDSPEHVIIPVPEA